MFTQARPWSAVGCSWANGSSGYAPWTPPRVPTVPQTSDSGTVARRGEDARFLSSQSCRNPVAQSACRHRHRAWLLARNNAWVPARPRPRRCHCCRPACSRHVRARQRSLCELMEGILAIARYGRRPRRGRGPRFRASPRAPQKGGSRPCGLQSHDAGGVRNPRQSPGWRRHFPFPASIAPHGNRVEGEG